MKSGNTRNKKLVGDRAGQYCLPSWLARHTLEGEVLKEIKFVPEDMRDLHQCHGKSGVAYIVEALF